MRPTALLFALLLVTASCASDPQVGHRYETERELYKANWEFQNLIIRPQNVSDTQWSALAQRYEEIAKDAEQSVDDASRTETTDEVQILAAQALFAAARIHGQLGDSVRTEKIFTRMANDYGHLPEVAAEVALARAGIEEGRGNLIQAADLYQMVVDQIPPYPGVPGAAGVVLDLPIRIAQLRTSGAPIEDFHDQLGRARPYYQRLIDENDGNLIKMEALDRMAAISGDLGDWDTAFHRLKDLEEQAQQMPNPPRHPSQIRLARAGMQRRSGAAPDSVNQTLESILVDYPKCEAAPQVYLALAENADQRGQVDEALGHLDRIIREYRDDEDTGPQALLIRGRLLAAHDRWAEAVEIFRALPIQHPLSEAALLAPLEIANHYHEAGDEAAATEALADAERHYREFITRYPPGPITVSARQRLIQTLLLQDKTSEAVDEYTSLGDELRGSSRGIPMMITAAGIARDALNDRERAAQILDHLAEVYAGDDVSKWAAEEAAKLRTTVP